MDRYEKIRFINIRLFGPTNESQSSDANHEAEDEYSFIMDETGKTLTLSEMSNEELNALYDRESKNLNREIDEYTRCISGDQIEKYALRDAWCLNEAFYLWFGLDPHNDDRLRRWGEKNYQLSKLAADVRERWDFITRARSQDILTDSVDPRKFVLWARRKNFRNPEIFNRVFDDHEQGENLKQRISYLEAEILDLKSRIENLNLILRDPKELKLSTLARIFGAVCIERLGFDPKELSRNSLPKQLSELMRSKGYWDITDRSVRTYIRVSIDVLKNGEGVLKRLDLDDESSC